MTGVGNARVGADDDGFELFLTRHTIDTMRETVQAAAPDETLGLLFGRSFRDDRGPYTLVTAATSAPAASAGPGHVQVTAAALADAKRRGERDHPALDTVGWFHSHDRPSEFSATDRQEQGTWTDPDAVGILVFQHGEPCAVAYRGPNARPLGSIKRPPQSAGWSLHSSTSPPSALPNGPVESRQSTWSRWTVAVAATVAATAAAGATLLTAAFMSHPSAPQSDSNLSLSSAATTTPDVAWTCSADTARTEDASGVQCEAGVGPGISGWWWEFDTGERVAGPGSLRYRR